MSQWTPCKRRDFTRRLRKIGFEGSYSGTRHQFMILGQHRLAIPSNTEFSVPQLRMMLREVQQIIGRDIDLDIFWLRDESLEESDNLPDSDVLAQEIIDDLEAALEQFREIATDLCGESK